MRRFKNRAHEAKSLKYIADFLVGQNCPCAIHGDPKSPNVYFHSIIGERKRGCWTGQTTVIWPDFPKERREKGANKSQIFSQEFFGGKSIICCGSSRVGRLRESRGWCECKWEDRVAVDLLGPHPSTLSLSFHKSTARKSGSV